MAQLVDRIASTAHVLGKLAKDYDKWEQKGRRGHWLLEANAARYVQLVVEQEANLKELRKK